MIMRVTLMHIQLTTSYAYGFHRCIHMNYKVYDRFVKKKKKKKKKQEEDATRCRLIFDYLLIVIMMVFILLRAVKLRMVLFISFYIRFDA